MNSFAYLVQSPGSADMLCGQPNKYVIRIGNNPPTCSPISHRYPLLASPFVISRSSPSEYERKQEIKPSKKRTKGITGIRYVQRSRDQRKGRRKGTKSQAPIGMNNTPSKVNECRADASKIPMACRFLALSCKRSRASSGFRWWKEEKSVLNPLRCPGI